MIILASDHAGFPLKEEIKAHLKERNIDFTDCGTDSVQSVDYAVFAQKACLKVVSGEAEKQFFAAEQASAYPWRQTRSRV